MSVTAPPGFSAGAAAAGLKAGGALDVALVVAEAGAVEAAAVLTTNRAPAAPVSVTKEHLVATGGRAAAVVLTAGNANAATGPAGRKAAEALCAEVARGLDVAPVEVLVAQTGLIGVPFPTEAVLAALPGLVAGRSPEAGAAQAAARAIMTTDTHPKETLVRAGGFTVGAMAKGAAMVAPRLATMLAVVTTDAACPRGRLRDLLATAVAPTFNALSIDGCTSTNDTVVALASGRAGPVPQDELGAALEEACGSLASMMAADAEGATKTATVVVDGAASDSDAERAARAVAGSLLVKCSLNGADPYWGRVVSELGASGAAFDPEKVAVAYGGVEVCRRGVGAKHDAQALAAHMAGSHIELTCHLGLGRGRYAVLTTDLGYGYLDENRTTS